MARRNTFFPLIIGIVIFLIIGLSALSFLKKTGAQDNQTSQNTSQIPGRIDGIGRHLALTDSLYLNVSVDSSDNVQLALESLPNMVRMKIAPVTAAPSVQITLSGFKPMTTYYKYQDNYHSLAEFITDQNGSYSYTQDLSKPHLIFIQTKRSTIFLRDDATGGDCLRIGTWDSASKICTLTTDINETVEIDSDGLTLDGNGHISTGSNTGSGVFTFGNSNLTIKNLKLNGFFEAISLNSSKRNAVTNNAIANNVYGVRLDGLNNTVTNNTISNNFFGIYLESGFANNNVISGNTITGGNWGIYAYFAGPQNHIEKNTITLTALNGVRALYTPDINIIGNTISGSDTSKNGHAGIYIGRRTTGSTYNIDIADNTLESNNSYGISLDTYPIPLNAPEKILIHRNSISKNGIYGVNSNYPVQLSVNNEGNYWGHAEAPCFRPGDSNDINTVIDVVPVCRSEAPKDITPPTITMPQILQEVPLNTNIGPLTFSATDDLSGVASVQATLDSVPVTNGAIVAMNRVGEHRFTVTAVDNSGNTNTQEIRFAVVYVFGGFLPPIKPDGTGIYKQGRILPVKFQLKDGNGIVVKTADAKLFIAKVTNGVVGADEPAKVVRFDSNEKRYIFKMSMRTMAAGPWQLRVALDDSKIYSVLITIRERAHGEQEDSAEER